MRLLELFSLVHLRGTSSEYGFRGFADIPKAISKYALTRHGIYDINNNNTCSYYWATNYGLLQFSFACTAPHCNGLAKWFFVCIFTWEHWRTKRMRSNDVRDRGNATLLVRAPNSRHGILFAAHMGHYLSAPLLFLLEFLLIWKCWTEYAS